MSNSDQQAAQRFVQRREKNLAYFKIHFPDLFAFFKDYRLQHSRVNVLTDIDEVDLWVNEQSLYGGKGRESGAAEVSEFLRVFGKGSRIDSIAPPLPEHYMYPRFAHRRLKQLVSASPFTAASEFSGYPIQDFYPLIVFLGCGLGYQIEQMVLSHEIENAIIVEPDLDVFAASLYAVDWAAIADRFHKIDGRWLKFLLGIEATESMLTGTVWNNLTQVCPQYPVAALFFVHRGDAVMGRVAEAINRDMVMFLGSWGQYDDEIRQLNNAIHGFLGGAEEVPQKVPGLADVPVVIMGSGPSVDARLPSLIANRGKYILVTAGTALRVALRAGLRPDFHFELESDVRTYWLLKNVDKAVLSKTRIVAPSHICPLVWPLFGERRFYFKAESGIGEMFGRQQTAIAEGAPTCTNSAIAVLLHWGARQLYLFGNDFGYFDDERHHAAETVYMHPKHPLYRAKADDPGSFMIEGYNGKLCRTVPVYFNTKRRAEILIRDYQHLSGDLFAYSCSDGARIENAQWIDSETFVNQVSASHANPDAVVHGAFDVPGHKVEPRQIKAALIQVEVALSEVRDVMIRFLKSMPLNNARDLSRISIRCGRYLEETLQATRPGFYFFIRGSIRMFLYSGFAHAMALQGHPEQSAFLKVWKREFRGFLEALVPHFKSITSKEYDLTTDPWVEQSIHHPEPLDAGA